MRKFSRNISTQNLHILVSNVIFFFNTTFIYRVSIIFKPSKIKTNIFINVVDEFCCKYY